MNFVFNLLDAGTKPAGPAGGSWQTILLMAALFGVMYFVNFANTKVNFLTYDEFMGEVEKGNVEEVYLTPRSRASVYEITGTSAENIN